MKTYLLLLENRKEEFLLSLEGLEEDRKPTFMILDHLLGAELYDTENLGQLQIANKDFERLVNTLESKPLKNPYLAGGLSLLLPGSGFAYLGMWQSASLSFLLTGISYWAAYDLNKQEQTGASLAAALVGSVFHLGGALGAADAALEINQRLVRPIANELLRSPYQR